MAVTLRYFTEFGKLASQKTICGAIVSVPVCFFTIFVFELLCKYFCTPKAQTVIGMATWKPAATPTH